MSNTEQMISVPRSIGAELLKGMYYPAECTRCGWIGSSGELTEDDAQCTQMIDADDNHMCLGDTEELDAHRLLGIIQKELRQSNAQHQGEPVAWSAGKPEIPGAYWIRGFNLSGEFNEAALVQVVRDEDANCLMVNLHQSTTERDTGYWYEVDDINAGFEWSGPLYLHPPTSDGYSAGDMADQGAKAFAARDGEVEQLRRVLGGMLFAFDDGVGVEWSQDLLDFARKLTPAVEFNPA